MSEENTRLKRAYAHADYAAVVAKARHELEVAIEPARNRLNGMDYVLLRYEMGKGEEIAPELLYRIREYDQTVEPHYQDYNYKTLEAYENYLVDLFKA